MSACFIPLMNFGFFSRGNAYLFTWARLGYRWAMHAGNFTVWSTEFTQMVTWSVTSQTWWTMATNLTTRSSAKPALGSTCPGLFMWTWSRALWVCFFANSRQMTQIQSYIVDIVTFWKSRLIRTLFIITEIIYIAISSWLFGKQSKELSWVRGEVRETVARCRKPRTTVSRVSSLLGDNSLTVSQVVTKELSRYHIYISFMT